MSAPSGGKAIAKRLIRPLAAPLLNRLAAMVARLENIEERIAELEAMTRSGEDARILQGLTRGWARTEARLSKLEAVLANGAEVTPTVSSAASDFRGPEIYDLLYPGLSLQNWQMQDSERMALTGLLYRLQPRAALEIGVYWGGSLALIAQLAERVWALDIDPAVPDRFALPPNVDLRIGNSRALIPDLLAEIDAQQTPLNLILIDADHSTEGVRRDIELVLRYQPRERLIIVMHDSGNPGCRAGIRSADWAANPHVHYVNLDFVPGVLIPSGLQGAGEVWGGLAIALLHPDRRAGPLAIGESAAATIAALEAAGI